MTTVTTVDERKQREYRNALMPEGQERSEDGEWRLRRQGFVFRLSCARVTK